MNKKKYVHISILVCLGALLFATFQNCGNTVDKKNEKVEIPSEPLPTGPQPPPKIVFTAQPPPLHASAFTSIEFSIDGNYDVVECKLLTPASATGSYGPCTMPFDLSGMPQGRYQYFVSASRSDLDMPTVSSVAWIVDTAAPVITLTPASLPANPTTSKFAAIKFSVSDSPGSGIYSHYCTLNDSPVNCGYSASTGNGDYNFNSPSDGQYTFAVTATDNLGATNTASHTWVVASGSPAISFLQSPESPTKKTNDTVKFKVVHPAGPALIQSVKCKLNNESLDDCTVDANGEFTRALLGLSEGLNTFSVQVKDTANQISTQNKTWVVDITPPTATIALGAPAAADAPANAPPLSDDLTDGTFLFQYTDTVGMGKAYCVLDADPDTVNPKPLCSTLGSFSYSKLAPGMHVLHVWAKDAAGNPSPTQTYQWEISNGGTFRSMIGGSCSILPDNFLITPNQWKDVDLKSVCGGQIGTDIHSAVIQIALNTETNSGGGHVVVTGNKPTTSTTSNLNSSGAGQMVRNLVTTGLSSNQVVSMMFVSSSSAQVKLQAYVRGVFQKTRDRKYKYFVPMHPCRINTATTPPETYKVKSDTDVNVQITGKCSVPLNADSIVANVHLAMSHTSAATGAPSGPWNLFAEGGAYTGTYNSFQSILTWNRAGAVTAGTALIKLAPNGTMKLHTDYTSANFASDGIIIDVTGYYALAPDARRSTRSIFTPLTDHCRFIGNSTNPWVNAPITVNPISTCSVTPPTFTGFSSVIKGIAFSAAMNNTGTASISSNFYPAAADGTLTATQHITAANTTQPTVQSAVASTAGQIRVSSDKNISVSGGAGLQVACDLTGIFHTVPIY